ncbi:MAG: hypothetical protein R3F61_19885 [Myxococcota bacterium]
MSDLRWTSLVAMVALVLGCAGGGDPEGRAIVVPELDEPQAAAVEPPDAPRPSVTSWPAECEAPAGAVVVLACAGGGRDLVDAFLEQYGRPFGSGSAHLSGLADRLPPADVGPGLAPAMDGVFEHLVQEAADLYPEGSDDPAKPQLARWTIEGDPDGRAIYTLLRESPALHYNAANGLLSLDVSRSDARDPNRRARTLGDLGADAATADRYLATSVGKALGDVAIAMAGTRYGEPRMSASMAGTQLPSLRALGTRD